VRTRRKFHKKNRLTALTEINVTPLIDLAFALLIIFMIATPLLEQTIPINLPGEVSKPQLDVKNDIQVVSISRQGELYWGSKKLPKQK
jgi:biopolymer transport protein ExbD